MRVKSATLLIAAIAIVLIIIWFFLPAFRGDIIIDPVFSIGPVNLHWYGIVIAIAVLVSYLTASSFAPAFGIAKQTVESLVPWVVIGGLAGARVYFIAVTLPYFLDHPLEILKIWQGGLSIYGAIIGASIASWIYARRNRQDTGKILGLLALVMPLGHAIGRIGNFLNQEAFGPPTDLPWKMYISAPFRPYEFLSQRYFHPTFLYDGLWNLAVFAILLALVRRDRVPKQAIFGSYLILYPMARFFLEDLRLDSSIAFGIQIDQAMSLALMLAGVTLLFTLKRQNAGYTEADPGA